MEIDKFNRKVGDIVPRGTNLGNEFVEFHYFLPKELPDVREICLDPVIFEKSNEANRALGELQGLTKNLGSLELFADAYMRKEAVESSKIEGTFVSLTEVFLTEAGSKKPEFVNPNVREVVNFVHAIQYGLKKLKEGKKIDKEILNEMHKKLLTKVRGQERLVGEFRKRQNWIQSKGKTNDIHEADFVPPSEEHVNRLMDYLFDYMNKDDGSFRLLKAALIHYYFETIHPYEDGNGRMGRTLILLYLIQSKVIDSPLLYLSPYFSKYKEAYYNSLTEVRETGNFTRWLKLFLEAVRDIALDTSQRVRKLIELYNEYKKRLVNVHATPISYILLDKFFENPYYFVSLLQEELGENYPKTKRGMNYLVKCEVIKLFTKHKRNKIFVAIDILKIMEENTI